MRRLSLRSVYVVSVGMSAGSVIHQVRPRCRISSGSDSRVSVESQPRPRPPCRSHPRPLSQVKLQCQPSIGVGQMSRRCPADVSSPCCLADASVRTSCTGSRRPRGPLAPPTRTARPHSRCRSRAAGLWRRSAGAKGKGAGPLKPEEVAQAAVDLTRGPLAAAPSGLCGRPGRPPDRGQAYSRRPRVKSTAPFRAQEARHRLSHKSTPDRNHSRFTVNNVLTVNLLHSSYSSSYEGLIKVPPSPVRRGRANA
jgi:hypothetical protein